ncbi:glycosyltransferase family 39 protein [Candidatus Woesearchaeota archaeon]|nr:glycosyltransferase family 39 protein [Candidatus Woesearchaeota archaeon]
MGNSEKTAAIAAAAIIILFAAIELNGLNRYENSDENIYIYMSSLLAQGTLPYRDFFYAHPPLELIIGAAVLKAFGFSIFIIKLIPLLATIITAAYLYMYTKPHFGSSAALLSTAFFLTSYRTMLEATYFMGLDIAVMLLVAGLHSLNRKPISAGILFAAAGMTRLLVIIPAAAIIMLTFLAKPRNSLKAAATFITVFGAANLSLAAIFPDYYGSVYKFHLMKPAIEGNSLETLIQFAQQNTLLITAALLSFLLWNRKNILFAITSAAYIIFVASLNRTFPFYLLAAIPLIAITAATATDALLKKMKYNKYAIIAVSAAFLLTAAYTANHLLTFDFTNFETAEQIAAYIKEKTGETSTIYGDATTTPLVALLSGRKISGNIVDTNELTYLSGAKSLQQELKTVKEQGTEYIITRPLYGIGSLTEMQEFLKENCWLEKHYKDAQHGDFLVYGC